MFLPGLLIIAILIMLCFLLTPPKTSWVERQIMVSKGDTLWSLSKRFSSDKTERKKWVNKVKKLNNTNGNIKKGQVITILVPDIENDDEVKIDLWM